MVVLQVPCVLLSPKSASETQRRAITSPRAMEVGTGRGNVQPLLPFAIVLMRTRGDRITCPKNEHVNRHTTQGENGLYIFFLEWCGSHELLTALS